MMRLFAHEVTDVEPVLGMLSSQNPQDCEVCTCKYRSRSAHNNI